MSLNKEHLIRKIIENNKKTKENKDKEVPLLRSNELKSGPLSPSQNRIYALHSACGSEDTAYNMSEVMLCEPKLKIDDVSSVIKKIVQRHDILRTSFHKANDQLVQKVHQNVDIEILEETIDQDKLDNWITNYIRPFDLTKPGQIRLALINTNHNQYLIFDSHHIIVDGMSASIINRELALLYSGKYLPNPKYQYLDYTLWINARVNSADYIKHTNYWKNEFDEPVSKLDLPIDFPRPRYQKYLGSNISFSLSHLTHPLKQLLKEENVTIHTGLFAIYSILLSRLTGQYDLVIGSPVLGRTNEEFKQMPGMFGNTLPIRVKTDIDVSFRKYLHIVKSIVLSALEHQECDLTHIFSTLDLERDPTRNPLFDALFVMQVDNISNFEDTSLSLTPQDYDRRRAQLDLSLEAQEKSNDIYFKIDYACSLFKKETIERFKLQFLQLIENIIKQPECNIKKLSLLNESEIKKITMRNNSDSINRFVSLNNIVRDNVNKYPNKIAIEYNDKTIKYNELNYKINACSNRLIECGVQPGDKIAMLMDRSINMIVSILGIIDIGAAYVPIEPETPIDRISFILKDSGSQFVVTDRKSLSQHNWLKSKVTSQIIEIDDISINNKKETKNIYTAKPTDPIYIIYTSGTTGQPKGVVVEQQSLYGLIKLNNKPHYDETDRWSMFHSYGFDFSVWEIFAPLLSGGTLVITPKTIAKDTSKFLDYLIEKKITILNQTPSAFYNLIDVDLDRDCQNIIALRKVIFGGEALIPGRLRKWHNRRPNVELINMYGITETTVHTTYKELTENDINDEFTSNIGNTLESHYIYILDKYRQLCAKGVTGEIYVGGMCVARGYLNRDSLTKERFVNDPFFPDRKIYKSGDLAKFSDSNEIIYIGRSDKQVKIRGHRVELGEIENNIIKIPNISDVCVFDYIDDIGNNILCAAVCSTEWSDAERNNIQRELKSSLPDYMIPTAINHFDKIPLTVSGKVDRKKLIEKFNEIKISTESTDNQLPVTTIEKKLAELWKIMFGVKNVGRDSDFFELGGHSLIATKMILKINSTFNKEISLDTIYKYSTLKELSSVIEKNRDYITESKINTAPDNTCKIIASPAQKRLFFIEETTQSPSITYNVPLAFNLNGDINENKLEHAIFDLVERHTGLRSYFELDDNGVLFQKKHKNNSSIYFDVENEVLVPPLQCVGLFVRPFDLREDYLFRVKLIRFHGSKRGLLLFDFHHIVCDGLSINIVLNDLSKLYNNELLTGDPVQYSDYCYWLDTNNNINSDLDYWVNKLKGVPQLNMFTDLTRPPKQSFKGGVVTKKLELDMNAKIDEICQKNHITPYILYLAVFSILLSRICNKEDMIIGSPFSGRIHPDLEYSVGMFVNTLPIRCKPDGNILFYEYVQELKKITVECHMHQNYLFEDLVNRFSSVKDMSHNPMFDCMLDVQPLEQEQLNLNNVESNIMTLENPTVKADLVISVSLGDETKPTDLTFGYAKSLYRAETVEVIAESFHNLLRQCVETQDKALKEYLLVQDSKAQSVSYGPKQLIDNKISIGGLFEKQVKRTPNKIAVSSGDKLLTYKELNNISNKIANFMHKNGISKGDIVIQKLSRSERLIASLLAILKIGAVYLPIEPSTPDARLLNIIRTSGAKVIIKDEREERDLEIANIHKIHYFYIDEIEKFNESNIFKSKEVISQQDIAYIIYTSGTTGVPKGVSISNLSLINLILWLSRMMYADPNKKESANQNVWLKIKSNVVLLNASVQFDASLQHLLTPILNGAELVIASDEVKQDPFKMLDLIEAKKIDTADFTPTHLSALLNYTEENKLRLPLKYVLVGGENLILDDVKSFYRLTDQDSMLFNVYGITETTVDSTCEYIDRNADEITVGSPLPNRMLCVLDAAGHPLPKLIPGQLYEAGMGLAEGYVNDSKLTKEKFKEKQWGAWTNKYSRLYDTGDISRMTHAGKLILLGRKDSQIKFNGYRIELEEIRLQINRIPGIAESVVVVKDINGSPTLCAFYVTESMNKSDVISENNILFKDKLTKSLPPYMIPTIYISVNEFKRDINGKIDYKQLIVPSCDNNEKKLDREISGALESRSKELWMQLLGVNNINYDDNFFAIGGDSIKAIQLASRWRKIGYVMSMDRFFESPTVQDVGTYLSLDKKPVNQDPISGAVEFSPIQKSFFDYEFERPDHWNQAVLLETVNKNDSINIEKVKKVFECLMYQHDMLRSKLSNNLKTLTISRPNSIDTTIEVLTTKEVNLQSEFDRIQRSIKLFTPPLIKIAVIATEQRQYLLIVAHHLIIDGVSWRILLEDFFSLYLSKGDSISSSHLPFKTTPYREWSNELELYANKISSDEIDYWNNINIESYDTKYNKINITKMNSGKITKSEHGFMLPTKIVESMFSTANRVDGFDINTVLLTSFYIATKHWRNKKALSLMMESHGRVVIDKDQDLSRTLGWFTSIYPVRFDIDGMNLKNHLIIVKKVLDNIPMMGIGYGLLLYKSNVAEEVKEHLKRLHTKISFNYLGKIDITDEIKNSNTKEGDRREIENTLRISSLKPGNSISENNNLTHDLQIEGSMKNDQVIFKAIFDNKEFGENSIIDLMEKFERSIYEIIDYYKSIDKHKQKSQIDEMYGAVGLQKEDLNNIIESIDI